jgi:signal transduction histidine kinase
MGVAEGERGGRGSGVVARTGLAIAGVLAVVAVALAIGAGSVAGTPTLTTSHLLDAVVVVALLVYAVVGTVIVLRRPDNRIGRTFLVAGCGFQLWVAAHWYAAAGLVAWPGSLPGATTAAWVSLWAPAVGFGVAFTFLLQLFPDGSVASPGWRPFAWYTGVALLVWAVTWGAAPGPMGSFGDVANPFGSSALAGPDGGLGWILFVVAVLGSVLSLVLRYVRSTGVTRLQIRWFTSAAALMLVVLVLTTLGSEGFHVAASLADLLFPVAIAAVPAAAFVAILRHDLYDLDLVVSRTMTFGVLLGLITLAYVAIVAGIGAAAGAAGELSVTVAVVVTAIVAVVFQPVRDRVTRVANRLLYGPQATPYEVLSGLSRRLASSLQADDALPQMARIVGEGVRASLAEVWLMMGDDLRRVAAWSANTEAPAITRTDGKFPHLAHADRTVPVRHDGDLLGAISVTLPPGRTLSPTEDRLLGDLASQAGLVLRNVALIEELKASRQRLVAAQDAERRRIERDIHDGVQQRLVTLALALRMAAARADPAVGVFREDGTTEERAKTADLRRLARGIHPAIVSEGGLAAAVESLAHRSPVPVDVDVEEVDGLSSTVEVTVYYLIAEALTNVAKHARASTVTVTLRRKDSRVLVEVADDGVGGASAEPRSGLTGMADRVAAIGGQLQIDSPAAAGTRLHAEIPCGS